MGVVTWKSLRLLVSRTGYQGETLRHCGEVRVGEARRQWAWTGHPLPGNFNLVTSTLAFFIALEGNTKPQDLKFYATAQI